MKGVAVTCEDCGSLVPEHVDFGSLTREVLDCPNCGKEGEVFNLALEDTYGFDCGMMPSGLCLKAGSEFCDWDCVHRQRFWVGDET